MKPFDERSKCSGIIYERIKGLNRKVPPRRVDLLELRLLVVRVNVLRYQAVQ